MTMRVQLAAALEGSTSKVIISTLQKYPFVPDKIAGGLPGRRYAVFIGEAHTWQGGDAVTRLKQVIGANAVPREDEDDETYMTQARGRQPSLSYFAFTAKPKSPPLKLLVRHLRPGPGQPPQAAGAGMYVLP
jgi:type I restriction enzyme R subunit